ncbi:MAG: acyl-CoA synthetase [Sphingomonadaceae bacterium]|nr:acyl-CoA synthetase [Sphingomonadaceae bacterium]
MHIRDWAAKTPDTPALIMAGSGETVTFAELERASNRGAQLLRSLGLKRGDGFALWSTNNARFHEITWSMQRSGLYMTPIASKLKAEETAYIVNDSGARVLIVDAEVPHAKALIDQISTLCPNIETVFCLNGALGDLEQWEDATAKMPDTEIADQSCGQPMIYSSGTTGRPKGIRKDLPEQPFDQHNPPFYNPFSPVEAGTGYMTTAPMYHVGTLMMTLQEQQMGATIILMEKFDAEGLLRAVDRYHPTRSQFVPTMFIRLLKLPPEVRAKYDVSSLNLAIHSAAPCPLKVKYEMIEWFGPILFDIYGGTESAGATVITSKEWLKKPGSVGRSVEGIIRICGDSGDELPIGETGTIFFETSNDFSYYNDPEKTKESRNPKHPGWRTYGDIGHVDEDGYLFLSDRRAFMVISGGVNIYPQEAENALILHPKVQDAAVFGVPDADLGEVVKAVIQPADWSDAGPEMEAELIAYCKSQLSTLKCPKTVDFEKELPRDITGKMMKQQLRASYWEKSEQG